MNNRFYTVGKGISMSEAQAVANLSNELAEAITTEFKDIQFFNEFKDKIGVDCPQKQTIAGETNVLAIISKLKKKAEYHSLNAWLREAVKDKTAALEKIKSTTINEWYSLQGIEIPKLSTMEFEEYIKSQGLSIPERPLSLSLKGYCEKMGIEFPVCKELNLELSLEDIKSEMNIKEYMRYLKANAKSAVFGKAVHPDGFINIAHKEAHKVLKHPFTTEGELISRRELTAKIEDIDALFTNCQSYQRSYNGEFNSINNKLRNELSSRLSKLNAEHISATTEYKARRRELELENSTWFKTEQEKYSTVMNELYAMYNSYTEALVTEYNSEVQKYSAQYNDWLVKETDRIGHLKIAIPEDIQDIFEEVRSLLTR